MAFGRSQDQLDPHIRDGVTDLLGDPRYELLPFASFDEQISYLPDGARIAITASPKKGIEETVERSVAMANDGYEITPHIAARSVKDVEHLEDIVERLTDAGITDVFVPGGDNDEPKGEFSSAYELLTSLEDVGHEFDEIGITGYPEGHHIIDEETLWEALETKQSIGTYIITQLCYDPDAIISWIDRVRDRGVDLPVHPGIPGVMKYQKLLTISTRVGVGDSISFLRKTSGIGGFIKQLVGSRGTYSPDDLILTLAEHTDDDHYRLEGIHLYTFNQVPDTESWRREFLENHG